jgi:hypothetical protein
MTTKQKGIDDSASVTVRLPISITGAATESSYSRTMA